MNPWIPLALILSAVLATELSIVFLGGGYPRD